MMLRLPDPGGRIAELDQAQGEVERAAEQLNRARQALVDRKRGSEAEVESRMASDRLAAAALASRVRAQLDVARQGLQRAESQAAYCRAAIQNLEEELRRL
jgi:hypothetical protein